VRIRLYFDEDSSRHSLARELRARGVDLATVLETGMAGKTDEEQLQWATLNDRVLYSFNRGDFYRLHTIWLNEQRSHSGIILSRQDLPVCEQMRRLLRLVNRLSAEEMQNRLEFLSGWGSAR
jgi:predicted nuclease of predicted toxin-antitoxin system